MIQNNIYFILSSMSFFQFYIPILLVSRNRNYKSYFIIKSNPKKYTCPFQKENNENLEYYISKYNLDIRYFDNLNIFDLNGIVIVVDGDIYGPPRKNALNSSIIFKLDRNKVKIFSLTEHLNFLWNYEYYMNDVDYICFTSKYIYNQINNLSLLEMKNTHYKKFFNQELIDQIPNNIKKNLYLGNTKFDFIPEKEIIYQKYNLNQNNKYCLFLYPKRPVDIIHIKNIYNHLKKLSFDIIVKSRPKDPKINDDMKGDHFIVGDNYPNQSIELMKISDLCIFLGSSALEETIYCKIPSIELIPETDIYTERNNFLFDEKSNIRIYPKNWENLNFDDFCKYFNKLEKKNSEYLNDLKNKFLFTHDNTSKKILDFFQKII